MALLFQIKYDHNIPIFTIMLPSGRDNKFVTSTLSIGRLKAVPETFVICSRGIIVTFLNKSGLAIKKLARSLFNSD